MTTDNKTLADVQPGGRVRLGDEAERARFEEWLATQHDQGSEHVMATVSDTDDRYQSPVTSSMWSAWQAANAAREGGRINGWRVVDGVRVYSAYAHASILDDQQYVRYEDYLAALSAQPSPATCKEGLQVQPSPGGQGEVLLEQVALFLDYSVGHDPWPNIRRAYGDAWWEPVRKMRDDLRALAASQPVETQLGYTLSDVHEAYSRGKRDAERQPVGNYEVQTENGPLKCSLAVYAEWQKNEEYIERLKAELKSARQPVGEPVCSGGFVISNGSGEKYMAWGQVGPEWTADRSAALWLVRRADAEALVAENEDAWSILPVERCALPPNGWACTLAAGHEGPCPTIAASPPQAVDLGQFRPAVELMEWQERGHANPDFPRGDAKKHAEALRLLALIDSQAVGK